jgi:hypothetical protein
MSPAIFSERRETTVGGPLRVAQLVSRGIVHHLGLALGGRSGQSLAQPLLLLVSNDTFLRIVRRTAIRSAQGPQVVGIDDFAWKRDTDEQNTKLKPVKGQMYGRASLDLPRARLIGKT